MMLKDRFINFSLDISCSRKVKAIGNSLFLEICENWLRLCTKVVEYVDDTAIKLYKD